MNITKTPEDFLVRGMENIQPAYADFPGTMYAGLLPMNHGERSGEMMFWLFQPDEQVVPETLTIWLVRRGSWCFSLRECILTVSFHARYTEWRTWMLLF